MPAPVYKIAIIQMHPKPLDIEANHAIAVRYIRQAAAQSCNLAVLPEYHLTSWVPDSPDFITLCAKSQTYLSAYCSLAASLNINIVPGTIVEKHGPSLHNIAYFISSTGVILGRYQKKNLWHPERPHLTSSTHEPHVAFDTPLGKVGLLICWDLAFPEAFRELIAQGAKLIIVPTFWTLADCSEAGLKRNPLAEELFLESLCVARAFENTCAVVFVNAGGEEREDEGEGDKNGEGGRGIWCGGSQVAVPFEGARGKMGWREGMGVVDVDMEILEEAEENYKVRQDMGREGWHYEYSLKRDQSNQTS
ncbi:carbon-nitrogen hydrolase [Rhexocercosporidium sp. MPI-PUGE-AT-0058]|nr:carbon-nitrogen hydrolase [Rhexocercosporidium sp. MPI-PUGE-AT-0058]